MSGKVPKVVQKITDFDGNPHITQICMSGKVSIVARKFRLYSIVVRVKEIFGSDIRLSIANSALDTIFC